MNKIIKFVVVMAASASCAFAAQNFVSSGDSLTMVNRTGATVTNETLVDLGSCYGIALSDVDSGDTGVFKVGGVWKMKIAGTEAITNGLPLFYSSATEVTKTAATNKYVGMATTTATGSTSTTVYVEFLLNAPTKAYLSTSL